MSPRNFSERDADFDVADWQLSKPEPQWRDGRVLSGVKCGKSVFAKASVFYWRTLNRRGGAMGSGLTGELVCPGSHTCPW